MSRYDRSYDYGLRGARDTYRSRGGYGRDFGPPRPRGYGAPRARDGWSDFDERGAPRFTNRVTARYNADYVYGARGPDHPRNHNMYTGDRMDRVGDARYYRRPYQTGAGTRTLRGSNFPTGYDYPDFGPDYGGRYPDEMY